MIHFENVTTAEQVEIVATLAEEIWNQHFVPIIGQAQVDYMVARFQSFAAITGQLTDGFEYFRIQNQDGNIGYMGLVPDPDGGRLMISKVYIKQQVRGQGAGNAALTFIEALCRDRGLTTVWLTVNRYNDDTIAWYKRKGFTTVKEVKMDIGNGFVMDDYVMELTIGPAAVAAR